MSKTSRDHTILERCIRNTKGTDYKQNALLRFCFLLDFFQISNFFELYEEINPSNYSSHKLSEGYEKTRAIYDYKKRFFNDSTRSNKPNRISDTLLPFWDFFVSIIMKPSFINFLTNPIQAVVLTNIQKKQIASPSFLFSLMNDYESFANFMSGTIIQYDRNRLDYFIDVDYQQRMIEYYGNEYETRDIPFPDNLFFEEIYSSEISRYDIYKGLLDNLNFIAYSTSHLTLTKDMLDSDLLFWSLIVENWDILFFIFRNEAVWTRFVFSCLMGGIDENLLQEQLSTVHDIPINELPKIIIKSEQCHLILNYNFRPTKRTAKQIFNRISKKQNSYLSNLFLEFCLDNYSYILHLDEPSIKYIYRLFILS